METRKTNEQQLVVQANRVLFVSIRFFRFDQIKRANRWTERRGKRRGKGKERWKEKWEKIWKERKREWERGRGREKESAISRSDFTWLLLIYYYEALLLPKNRKVS